MHICDELEIRLTNPLMKVTSYPTATDPMAIKAEMVNETCPVCEARRAVNRARVQKLRKRRAKAKEV